MLTSILNYVGKLHIKLNKILYFQDIVSNIKGKSMQG
jgi:hypothetical protein